MSKEIRKKAVALKYDSEKKSAPHVIAKGQGEVAKNIIDEAKNNDVNIHEDKALTQMLYQLDVNEQIPPNLYPIIAEVFALIYQAEKNVDRKKKVTYE